MRSQRALQITNALNFAETGEPHANVLQPRNAHELLFRDRPWSPISTTQGCDGYGDESASHIRIEIAHRLFVQVDCATGFQRSDIILSSR
jgi:hypothetical protein